MTTLLLPPSETKRDGGAGGSSLELARLAHAEALMESRSAVLEALAALVAGDDQSAARALKVGAKLASAELARDRAVRSSPTMAAIERYTGVLYDALDAGTLSPAARSRADAHVIVHSALFGLVAGQAVVWYTANFYTLFYIQNVLQVDQFTANVLVAWALLIGFGIGLLSGMVGIGGGIFLSPVILFARWGTSKQASAMAAACDGRS